MRYPMEAPGLAARISADRRRASMASFERLSTRVLMVGSVGLAVAMVIVICTTTHLLG